MSGPPPFEEEMIEKLTPREMEVLSLLAIGLTNKEIAERLVISPLTVQKHHVPAILGKMGVRNRTEAAVMAVTSGLVEIIVGQTETG